MIIKFTDGIEIMIDDEKLVSYEKIAETILLNLKQGVALEVDTENKSIRKIGQNQSMNRVTDVKTFERRMLKLRQAKK